MLCRAFTIQNVHAIALKRRNRGKRACRCARHGHLASVMWRMFMSLPAK